MAFVLAFGIGLILTPAARALGLATGLVDRPGDPLKIHARPVPVLGGIAVVAATFGALAASRGLVPAAPVVAVVILLAMGMVDDARSVPPWVRLVAQTLAGVALVVGGMRLEPLGPLAAAAVVLVVILSANAVNMMDGQDGLVGGLGAIAALALAAVAGWAGAGTAMILCLGLAGALCAFLLWNRPPARIFLGNGGAYAVGALLAIAGMMIALRDGWRGLLAAGTCLGVFAFEVVYTVVRRVRWRAPVIPGDRLHSYDVLAGVTASRGRSTVVLWLLGLVAGGLGLLVARLPLRAGLGVLAVAVPAAVVLWGGFLVRRTRILRDEGRPPPGR